MAVRKQPDLPFSHPVAVATLHGATHLILRPDEAARARIAALLGLHAVNALEAELAITQANNGRVDIEGQLRASVQPVCVVSLEPFPQEIAAPVQIQFAPEALIERMTKRAAEEENEDFEPPDPILEGQIDFGAVVVEFLALSLDPYPRKPGAAFAGGDPEPARQSPFEALLALKLKDDAG
ncbi:MAG: DUF177 domain-containing protein [Beijerinckiaceae bacterium]|nr:DUF177 domain-containing protein [Beijerinckiaceae bacterium]